MIISLDIYFFGNKNIPLISQHPGSQYHIYKAHKFICTIWGKAYRSQMIPGCCLLGTRDSQSVLGSRGLEPGSWCQGQQSAHSTALLALPTKA